MSKIFTHSFRVQKDAIDENNHVNNVVYVHWMQNIAILHSTAQGWSKEAYLKSHAGWVAKSHYIQYKSPAFLDDEILAHTWISNMGKLTCLRKYKFIRKSDSKVLAEAETEWVFIKIKTGRPTRITESVQNSFQILPVNEEP
ncbi:MAG: acyl-CoA thioesterase [Desulfobacteraceae bacterium]|nr:acyl-CoA thioesterase [Desulfobacteraceae bacterium]